MPRLAKQDKEFLDATREEAVKWLSEKDAARYRKDVERLNRPSKKPEVSHAKTSKD
jgi:hypothetical protein